jgi:hypothetical protein
MEQLNLLFTALEQSAPVNALKASFYVYPSVNAVHILAIGALLTTVALMDLRILGFFRNAEPGIPVPLLRNVALAAFAVAALTGLTMFSIRATEYVSNPVFLAKMTLIPLAILNFLIFLRLAGPAGERPDLYPVPAAARTGAALSILLWLAVAVCGRFIGFV